MYVAQFPEESTYHGAYARLMSDVIGQPTIHVGEWQAMDVSKSKLHATHEIEDASLVWDRLPMDLHNIFPYIDRTWADEHFAERVSGQPLNPAPSHVRWPYAIRGNADHTTDEEFDHTYPERFWPRHAGNRYPQNYDTSKNMPHSGIRYEYGDLADVVSLLVRSPLTRQAFLPVWFPEDTGAVFGQRVPCTLGYHFMQRGGRLSMRYYLRSCDIYRHLANDVYLAARLLEWVCAEVTKRSADSETPVHFRPGGMVIHISSLHSFVGDKAKIEDRILGLASL